MDWISLRYSGSFVIFSDASIILRPISLRHATRSGSSCGLGVETGGVAAFAGFECFCKSCLYVVTGSFFPQSWYGGPAVVLFFLAWVVLQHRQAHGLVKLP